MEKLTNLIPLVLLMGTVPLAHSSPNIAQSIMLAALSGLVGYVAYLNSLKKPDLEKIFKERLEKMEKESDRKLGLLLKEIEELKANQGKLSIVQGAEERIKNFKW